MTATPLQRWMRRRLRGAAEPLWSTPVTTIPAATLWVGSRLWVRALRERGVRYGTRVGLDAPWEHAGIYGLLACLWEGACAVTPGAGPTALNLSDLGPDVDGLPASAPQSGGRLRRDEPPSSEGPLLLDRSRAWSPAELLALLEARPRAEARVCPDLDPAGALVALAAAAVVRVTVADPAGSRSADMGRRPASRQDSNAPAASTPSSANRGR